MPFNKADAYLTEAFLFPLVTMNSQIVAPWVNANLSFPRWPCFDLVEN
jgi:hypothetical protein